MRFAFLPLLVAAIVTACGGGSDAPTPPAVSCSAANAGRQGPWLAIADARQNAAAGSTTFDVAGSFPRSVSGRASAFEGTVGPAAITVLDAFATDPQGRPTAELFLFLRAEATTGTTQLVPVTLSQLRDPGFLPNGSVAVYAEHFDAAAGDYTRFLVAQSGTVHITSVSSGDVGRMALSLALQGEWRDRAGALLGCGNIAQASVNAPLLRLGSRSASLSDTLTATLSAPRSEELATATLDAFQVLHPDQARLAIVGSIARDSTRELWLSLNGIPTGGTITLGEPTLDEARAGRAAVSFGMLRVKPAEGTPGGQLWRSTHGEVELTNIVQAGPLALCGWVSGRYRFEALGTDLSSDPGTPVDGRMDAEGAFESKFTVLSPSDSLTGTRPQSSVARFARSVWGAAASPAPANGNSCPF